MKKQSLKILFPVLISAAFLLLTFKKAESCAPYLAPDDYYTIFDNSLYKIPDLKPFFLSENVFADQLDGSEESLTANLKDWLKFLKDVPSADHIEKVIYKTTFEELEQISSYLKTGSRLPVGFEDNSFVRYLKTLRSSEIIDYLRFTKQCEPEVTNDNSWEEKHQNTQLMKELIGKGLENLRKAKKSFIRERYAYQVIRLSHYLQQYNKTVELYDRFFNKKNNLSLIQYWSLAHKAGALKSLGHYAESNYLFSRVFDNCLSRRRQSILSIELQEDSLVNEALRLCRNNNEKALIYTMAAYQNPGKSIQFISPVFSLSPKSEYPLLLLSREITRLERLILPTKANWAGQKSYLEDNPDFPLSSGNELFEVVKKIAGSDKLPNSCLWNFAAGYIATLINRTEDAKPFYFAAKKSCPADDFSFLRRIQTAEIVNRVNSLSNIDRNSEDNLTGDIKWLYELNNDNRFNAKEALIYIMNTLARKYWKQGDQLKANLCLGISIDQKNYTYGFFFNEHDNAFGYDIKKDYHLEPVDKIYETISEKFKQDDWYKNNSDYMKRFSEFERFLIDNYSYSVHELEYIQAKSFIAKGEFDKAVLKLGTYNSDRYSDDMSEKLPADPFAVHIIDCHDCDYNALNINRYTILGFSKRMLELEQLAKTDTANAAAYYFLIANGLYNKSYYGNSWIASAFRRTSSPWGYYEGFNYSFYDCSQAQNYYLKAMSLTKDREFAAKCLFMASKCELNSFYNKPQSVDQQRVPLQYRTLFGKLRSDYSDTRYYQEVLAECRHFRNFALR